MSSQDMQHNSELKPKLTTSSPAIANPPCWAQAILPKDFCIVKVKAFVL